MRQKSSRPKQAYFVFRLKPAEVVDYIYIKLAGNEEFQIGNLTKTEASCPHPDYAHTWQQDGDITLHFFCTSLALALSYLSFMKKKKKTHSHESEAPECLSCGWMTISTSFNNKLTRSSSVFIDDYSNLGQREGGGSKESAWTVNCPGRKELEREGGKRKETKKGNKKMEWKLIIPRLKGGGSLLGNVVYSESLKVCRGVRETCRAKNFMATIFFKILCPSQSSTNQTIKTLFLLIRCATRTTNII